MLSDKELKKVKKVEFTSDYEKYYPVKTLTEMGFSRYICDQCKRGFWSIRPRKVCNEPECDQGYSFIGKKLIAKFDYKGGYDLHRKFFEKLGYHHIKRYPVIARWYDKLYFVSAGINIFQPYVVTGEVPPPYQATIEDQFCLRFNDIDNVGITGRHYTGLIMIGHHVFNTPKKKLYFKEEGVKQFTDFFLKKIRIPKRELILHEDVWVGGGNFGPSIEFFAYGLELGNQVYMQYEQLPDGRNRELQTKVIDMGSGAERWAWLSSGKPMSYDVVFPKVMKYLYKAAKVKPNKNILEKFAKWSSILNVDESDDLDKAWKIVSEKTGISLEELKKEIMPLAALYSIADHTRSILVAVNDGELPSNVGGGYNIRNILRRCFSFIDKYKWNIDLKKVMKLHIQEFGKWYKELKKIKNNHVLFEILELEKDRYRKTISDAKKIIQKQDSFDLQKLLTLYESNGITPEFIQQVNPNIKIPANFYAALDELKKKSKSKKEELQFDVAGIKKTKLNYRKDYSKTKFSAKVITVNGPYIILDQTYFYPRSGGQDYDLGTINGIPLKAVWIKNGVVLHELDVHSDFEQKFKEVVKGKKVRCNIDKERRKQLTITHTAVHIVGNAARKVLGNHVNQAGAEKTTEKGKLDITHFKSLSFEEYQKIEKVANQMIKKHIRVSSKLMSRQQAEKKYGVRIYQGGAVPGKELRIIKVGNDVQACGGTHTMNTKAIKFIKFINAERIKDGIVRLEFMVGDKAIKRAQENEKILKEVSKLWDVSYKEIPKTASKFFEEWKDQRKDIKHLKEKFSEQVVRLALDSNKPLVTVELPIEELGLLISLSNKVLLDNKALILVGKNLAYGKSENPSVDISKELSKICRKVDGTAKKAKGFDLI